MFLQSFCYICAYEFSFGNMDKIQKQRGSILLYMEEKHDAYYIRIEHPGMACCVPGRSVRMCRIPEDPKAKYRHYSDCRRNRMSERIYQNAFYDGCCQEQLHRGSGMKIKFS